MNYFNENIIKVKEQEWTELLKLRYPDKLYQLSKYPWFLRKVKSAISGPSAKRWLSSN